MLDRSTIAGITLVAAITLLLIINPKTGVDGKPEVTTQSTEITQPVDYFGGLELEAKAIVVLDINEDKIMYERNSRAELPLASLTKILTAITVLETLPEGWTVEIDNDTINTQGDSGFYLDEKWKVEDLINLMLVSSINDGAEALAKATEDYSRKNFIQLMNIKADKIGLENSYFLNPSGLDLSDTLSGSYGTALDMARLMAYAYLKHDDIFDVTTVRSLEEMSESGLKHSYNNTNTFLEASPGLLVSKTGFTDLAGGNLVTVFDASIGRPIAIVILGSTSEARFSDTLKLTESTIKMLANQ